MPGFTTPFTDLSLSPGKLMLCRVLVLQRKIVRLLVVKILLLRMLAASAVMLTATSITVTTPAAIAASTSPLRFP